MSVRQSNNQQNKGIKAQPTFGILLDSVLMNQHGKQVIVPQFKQMSDIYQLVPTSIKKHNQDNYETRQTQLQEHLDNQLDAFPNPDEFVSSQNTSDSAFLHSLLVKEEVQPLSCFFQNDFYLCFKNEPTRDEFQKRARIFAKVYMKNHLKSGQHRVVDEIAQMKQVSEEIEDDNNSKYIQNKLTLNNIINNEILENHQYEDNPEISIRIQELYKQISVMIDNKVYTAYQNDDMDETIKWKKCKQALDGDMNNVTDLDQLLRILIAFKTYYKL